jgi:hypothetical protein
MASLPQHFVGAVQLVLRSGTGRILLQNGHERHAHKANSKVVMSLYCVLKKGHYVFCAVQIITNCPVTYTNAVLFFDCLKLKILPQLFPLSHSPSDIVYSLFILRKAFS